jgi:predicted nucleic acid-binding protein
VGLIVDSSVIIAGERRGHSVRQILEQLHIVQGEVDLGLSVVTIVELTHGIYRARDVQLRQRRQAFVDELARDVPVHSITLETARMAGRIEGEQAEHGLNIAFEDFLIASTALELGYGVATSNVRHFQVIPGLTVVKL